MSGQTVDLMGPELREMLAGLLDNIETVSVPYPGLPSYLIVWKNRPQPELLDAVERDREVFWQTFGKWGSRITVLDGRRMSLLNVVTQPVTLPEEPAQEAAQ